MTLQLGVLRDALLDANASPDKASAAAEAVGAYGTRLTRLMTISQLTGGGLLVLLAGQAALLIEVGKLSGTVSSVIERSAETNVKLSSLDTQQQATAVKLAEVSAQQQGTAAKLAEVAIKLAEVSAQQSALSAQQNALSNELHGFEQTVTAKLNDISAQIAHIKP